MRAAWLLALTAVGCSASPGAPEATATTSAPLQQCLSTSVQGVDVSDGQGTIDWASVKAAGVDFAIMKATQGNYDTQTTFAANWAGAKAAGVVRSPYHFFDPTVDGTAQAQYFLSVVGTLGPDDLPAMLDVECPDGDANCLYTGASGQASAADIATRLWDLIHAVEQATGKKPILYTFPSYFSSNGIDTTGLEAYPLYIADITSGTCFDVPSPWSTAVIWQYSWTGTVSGISDQVDQDQFIGSLADLQQFARSGADALAEVNGNSAMSMVNWPSDGHVEVYATTSAGTAMHVYTNPGTDTWTQVYDYPGAATCGVASAMWPAGASGPYAQLFDPTAAGSTQQLSFGASGWTPFADFGGQGLTQLSTVVGLDGHVEVYGLAPDGSMRANAWNLTTGAWSGWQPLGGTKLVTGAAPIVWNDGHIALFALDGQGAAWTDSETAGTWSGWTSMGGQLASRPVPARWADGHVEVFARGLDGHTWSSSWSTGWQPFTSIESTTALSGQLSVLVNPGGAGAAAGPELFGRLASGQVGHLTWSGTAWTTWAPLGDQQAASDPQAWIRADDTGQVFAVDPGGNLVQDHRDATGAWKGWATIATGIAPCVETLTIVADAGADGAAPADAATPDGAAADGGGGTAPATAGKGSSGGCSCRSAGQVPAAGGAGGGVVALLLMLAVWGRRRHPPGHVLAGRSKSRHADDRHP